MGELTSVKNVASCINNALPMGCLNYGPDASVGVQKILRIKQQIEILCGFRQKEGFHPILDHVITNILDLIVRNAFSDKIPN